MQDSDRVAGQGGDIAQAGRGTSQSRWNLSEATYLFGELVREDDYPRHEEQPAGTRALNWEHLGVSLECLWKVLSRGVPGSDSRFTQVPSPTDRSAGGSRVETGSFLQGSGQRCWWLGPGWEPEQCPEADGPRHRGRRAWSCCVHHAALRAGGRAVMGLHRRLLGEDVCCLPAFPFHRLPRALVTPPAQTVRQKR